MQPKPIPLADPPEYDENGKLIPPPRLSSGPVAPESTFSKFQRYFIGGAILALVAAACVIYVLVVRK